ncbi:MAG: lycopene cyclase domain-containing protein [Nitrospirota bacterium]
MGFILQLAFKVKLYRSTAHLIAINLLALIVLTTWDNFAIWRGHWLFGQWFLLGPRVGLIPIEEVAFMLIVSYFGLVIYKIVEKKLKQR